MEFLSTLPTRKAAWQLLALTALGLEISALFFQYGLKLEPCIMCIYQRVAIMGILAAGLIGLFYFKNTLVRFFAFLVWGVSAIWGLLIAIEHKEIQDSAMSFLYSCDVIPNFPQWLPLHEWIPFIFEATGDCADIDWHFLDFTMPEVMIFIFALYTISLFSVLLSQLVVKVKNKG